MRTRDLVVWKNELEFYFNGQWDGREARSGSTYLEEDREGKALLEGGIREH